MDKLQICPYVPADANPLYEAAKADGHGVAAPTHVIFKDGKPAGYLSIGVVPTVLLWLDSKAIHIRDTLKVQEYYEQFLKDHNVSGFLVPIPSNSPLQPLAEKLGHQLASPNTMIYYKQLLQVPTGRQT